mgnify:CR=1 FL=1
MKGPDWKKIRAQFPALKKCVYLNAAGGSPVPRPVAEAGIEYYKESLNYGELYWQRWGERQEKVRAALARFIGAAPEEVGFTLNTSHGMSLIAGALKGRGAVLTMHDEFPSSTVPWLNAGFKLKFVKPEQGRYTLENIEKHLTPDVKVLLTSYVQYRTGFRQDLEALGRLCRRKGVVFVVNATQAFGAMPVDVRKAGIDFMAFSCFKWTVAGYGAAAIYASKRHLKAIKFPEAGWRSVPAPEVMDNKARAMKKAASAVEAGCMHFPSIFALGAAVKFLSGIGVRNIQRRILELDAYLEEGLAAIGAEVDTPLDPSCRSGITIIKVKDPARAAAALEKMGILLTPRGRGVRVSLHFYNDRSDIDRLIAGLKKLGRGQLDV